jgi:hypothetical protein
VTAASKLLLRTALVCLALAAAAVHSPAPAAAATPCWKALLNDWYDGRIDKTYAKHCYTDAIAHLPADVSTYSSAHDDIVRALQSAVAKEKKAGKTVGPNTLLPGAPPTKTTTGTTSTTPTTTDKKGIPGLAKDIGPSSATGVPVPLLVLGGLALLLVAAGAAGLVAKRIQARKPGA